MNRVHELLRRLRMLFDRKHFHTDMEEEMLCIWSFESGSRPSRVCLHPNHGARRIADLAIRPQAGS